eukprot:2063963-Rhodomonas_salina.1
MQPGRKRNNLEGILVEMRKAVMESSRADLQRAPPLTQRHGTSLPKKHSHLRVRPNPAAFDTSTAELPKLRVQDDLYLWLDAIEAEHCVCWKEKTTPCEQTTFHSSPSMGSLVANLWIYKRAPSVPAADASTFFLTSPPHPTSRRHPTHTLSLLEL